MICVMLSMTSVNTLATLLEAFLMTDRQTDRQTDIALPLLWVHVQGN